MTRNRGVYRFGVPVYKWRKTKFWTQAELDECRKEAAILRDLIGWN